MTIYFSVVSVSSVVNLFGFRKHRRQPRPEVIGSRRCQIEQRPTVGRAARLVELAILLRASDRRTSAAFHILRSGRNLAFSPASSVARAIAASMKPILSTRPFVERLLGGEDLAGGDGV